VIVVAGPLGFSRGGLTGAGAIAARVAAQGAVVEAVGAVSAGVDGDRLLLELTTAGVHHAAVLRTSAPALDGPDLDLALRYLPDLRAIVVVDATDELTRAAADAVDWADAALILVTPSGSAGDAATSPELPPQVADRAVVLAAPASDPDGAFAGFVAGLAVRLADGATPADAWTSTATALGVEPVSAPSRA